MVSVTHGLGELRDFCGRSLRVLGGIYILSDL